MSIIVLAGVVGYVTYILVALRCGDLESIPFVIRELGATGGTVLCQSNSIETEGRT